MADLKIRERDLQKDMETCQRATPGPWYREKTGANFNGFSLEHVIADTAPCCTGNKVYAQPKGGVFSNDDANFIAEAREGWPEAIIRAMEAEEENAKLKKALELACIRLSAEFGAHPDGSLWEFWREYFLQIARDEHDQA